MDRRSYRRKRSTTNQQFEFERDRQAVAALLAARGQHHAAAIVAASTFESSCVGGFTEEFGYRATLHVPPELYDSAQEANKIAINLLPTGAV